METEKEIRDAFQNDFQAVADVFNTANEVAESCFYKATEAAAAVRDSKLLVVELCKALEEVVRCGALSATCAAGMLIENDINKLLAKARGEQ